MGLRNPDTGASLRDGSACVEQSASPRRLNRGDIDLPHRHHGVKGALRLGATGRHRHWLRSAKWHVPAIHRTSDQGLPTRIPRDGCPVPPCATLPGLPSQFRNRNRSRLPRGHRLLKISSLPATALVPMLYAAFAPELPSSWLDFLDVIGIIVLRGRSLSSTPTIPGTSPRSLKTEMFWRSIRYSST